MKRIFRILKWSMADALAAVFRIVGIGLCPFYPVAVLLLLLGAVAALAMAAPAMVPI